MNARKTVIITGSSQGIGEATAILFSKKGFNVVLHGRNKEKLESAKKNCELAGAPGVLAVELELSNQADLTRLIRDTVAEFGGIDVLVNNAAFGQFDNLEDMDSERLDKIFAVNVKAPILLTKAAIPHLKKSRGAIVNISSFASGIRTNKLMSYAITKAALDQFSLILSGNYAPDGVRVNTIRPASVATDFAGTTGIPKETIEKMTKAKAAKHPLAGLLKPEEVAQAIWMCCDPEMPSLTGQNITIHGGRIEDTPWVNPFD
ncbi:unnamed protein product [Oikopleura dioica]|uniref:Uncharacterized protein n=1 Tax=Oikopleura dioica TaxID=34765 RepID=E4XV21_OIKDI|nr:unnamed protein product [Oikopleura dioica]